MWGNNGDDFLDGITGETGGFYDLLWGGSGDDTLSDATIGGTCNGGDEIDPPYDGCDCPDASKVECEYDF